MNNSLKHCRGNFINFLNAGDSFSSEYTLENVAKGISEKTDIISGSINSFNSKGEKRFKSWKEQYDPKQYMFCFHQTMFSRKEIFQEFKFNTIYKVCADYDWTLRCLLKDYNFQFIDEALVNFEEGGFSDKNKIKGRIEELFIQTNYFECNEDILDKNALSKLLMYKKNNNFILPKLLEEVKKQLTYFRNKNKVFSLYGYGLFCEYIIQNKFLNFREVFDINYEKFKNNENEILIKDPNSITYDPKITILITALGHENEIVNFLISKGFNSKNICKFKF